MAAAAPARLSAREGRKFAFAVGPAFLALAAILLWREHVWPAAVAGTLGGALTLAGALAPTRLGPVERAWMALAHAISRVTTPIFLTLVYFLVFLPIGILRRVIGGNPLVRPPGPSFWVRRAPDARRSDLERQF